ncbi:helix-turn-helix transcriptional regulator [Pseudomonas aeruginosa]|uniref:helix-turn-helix transcriptional regulator n=2 Tax=Pseudomonas TaxID=286 RepID=UPI00044F3478|nr:helix-turn-helix transcriptional regulator [Pseudomonas aeruginosa]KAJ08238.1 repressor [Pseudomonas aeruginosa IGB83]
MEPVKREKEVDLSAKLKAIRATERLTQVEFCSLVDISLSSWKKYEASITDMGLAPVLKITNHPRFKKYTLWLMTGDTAPECGQVSPE